MITMMPMAHATDEFDNLRDILVTAAMSVDELHATKGANSIVAVTPGGSVFVPADIASTVYFATNCQLSPCQLSNSDQLTVAVTEDVELPVYIMVLGVRDGFASHRIITFLPINP